MDLENTTPNDEAALDAELEASIASVKAGKNLEPAPTPVEPSEEPKTPVEETPEAQEGDEGKSGDETSTHQPPAEEQEFRIPNKGKFESDESYEKRVELFDLVKRKKAATSEETKQELSEQIKQTKAELKSMGISGRFNNSRVDTVPPEQANETDPAVVAERERIQQLNLATKDDVAEIVRQERLQQDVTDTLKKFVAEIPELQDADVREIFFDFVESNYVWEGKSGSALRETLGMAYENMFRPSETVSERVLKSANVAEKVGVMQFPGGTAQKTSFSSDMQASIDQLKATGMSEEKAIELLSE